MHSSRAFAPVGAVRSLGYRLLWECSTVLQKAANGCLYVAAGLLRQDDLRAASQTMWDEFGSSRDDGDLGLETWERRLYGDHLRPADHVLLVGCGTGRDLVGLKEMGYRVTGLEPAPKAADRAREHLARRGMTATVLPGFVETADLGPRYDAVAFSPGVYAYVPQSASRVATLARIKEHLCPEGRVVISYTQIAQPSLVKRWLVGLSARLSGADWYPERGDCFSRDYYYQRLVRYEHLFSPGEVARECAAAGLRVIHDEIVMTALCCLVAVPGPSQRDAAT